MARAAAAPSGQLAGASRKTATRSTRELAHPLTFLFGLALLAFPIRAFGAPTTVADQVTPATERHLVDIALAGEAVHTKSVDEILQERLSGHDFRVTITTVRAVDPVEVVTPGASNDDQLARVWIDMTNHERVTLYIVDGTWERVLVRHLARNENPEVTWEGLGHIVELAMVALRAGETIGIGRETLRAQLVPPPPPPPPEPYVFVPIVAPRPALRFHAGAFYETALQGSGPQIAMGPGIVLELEKSAPRASYGVALTAQYRLPLTVDEGIARVRTEGAALRGLVTFGLPLSRSNVLTPALGAGVDVVHSEAIGARTTALRLVPPQTDAIPVLRAQLRFEHRAPGLRLFGGAGLDVPFDNRRYVLAKADSREVLYAPWAVRPFVFAGVETP